MFGEFSYLIWMLVFTLLAITMLWARYSEILWANRKTIIVVGLLSTLYQVIVDPFAESWHAWFIAPDKTVGLWIGNFPIENTLFFLLVSIAISSFVISRIARNKY